MQFLRVSPLQVKKKKKVDHWLLMLMRMLAIGLLAFLLARPRIPQNSFVPKQFTDAPVDVAIILDHSLSTGRISNGQTVFDRAVAEADKILARLKPTDTFSIVLAEHKPRPLNLQPVRRQTQPPPIQQLRCQRTRSSSGRA